MYEIVYFSNVSENTKRFVGKLDIPATRIPLKWDSSDPLLVSSEYVLVMPTYGGGSDNTAVPRQVVKFLNIEQNRSLLRGIVGTGNTNFGPHYCKGAEIVSAKTGVPLLYRVEITGTLDDVEQVKKRMELLWRTNIATTN